MTYNESLMEHNRRMRTDPMYRMLEMMEDMRVDMIPGRGTDREETGSMSYQYFGTPEPETSTITHASESRWNKRQWGIVNQLRLEQKDIRKLIYKTLKEKKEKDASKDYEPF